MKYSAFVLVLLFGAGVGIRAQDGPEKYAVVGIEDGDTLNVRSRPNESSSIVTKLRNGYGGITIRGEVVWNGGDDWVPILFSNAKGWVRPKYLSPQDDAIAFTEVPVRRATIAEPDEDAFDESPAKNSTVPSASNNNDAVLLALFGLLSGAIILDELSGGDRVSQDESAAQRGYTPADAEYDRQKYQRRENEIATSREDPLPYPNAPR